MYLNFYCYNIGQLFHRFFFLYMSANPKPYIFATYVGIDRWKQVLPFFVFFFFVIYLDNSWSIIKVYSLCWLRGSLIAIHQIAFLPK